MPPELTGQLPPLYDTAVNDVSSAQDTFREKFGKAMFRIGGTTFVCGGLGALLASMLQHPEGANILGAIAAAGLLAQVPPTMLGHLPNLGENKVQ